MKRYREALQKRALQGSVTTLDRTTFIQSELGDKHLIEGIEAAAKKFGDRDERYERAYRYHLWSKGRESTYPLVIEALVDERSKLQRICKSLDKKLSDGSNLLNLVHYGTEDYVAMSKVKELLETTA